jgi:hypothetical protein
MRVPDENPGFDFGALTSLQGAGFFNNLTRGRSDGAWQA